MKRNPLLIVCCLATIAFTYSCQKTSENMPGPKPATGEKALIHLRLDGDITINQSALPGSRKAHNYVFARTLRDSTIYAVGVRIGNTVYAAGLFNNPDSISLELPKNTSYNITAAAFKRGSGTGLYYDIYNGLQYFQNPLYIPLENKMVYNTADSGFLHSLTFATTFAADTTNPFGAFFPELDSYTGNVYLNADSSQTLNIPMRRIVFGIKYSAVNFTGGYLMVQYSNSMQTKYLTPDNIGNSLSIYTADEFRNSETITSWERIIFTLKWIKPDGSTVTLGDKELFPPNRNYITTVNITLPTTSTSVNAGIGISLTDTVWTSNNIINF